MTADGWLTVFAALFFASLVPVVWAIVDVVRRPAWQFSAGRKAMWAFSLGLGWLLLWPVALVSSIVYLTVLRRRLPQSTSPPGAQYPPFGQQGQYGNYGHYGHYGQYGQYGPGPYGAGPRRPGPQGASAYGADPYGYPPQPPPPPQHLPPAGWYPDPAGSTQERWWDGRGWSDHLR